MLTVEQLASLGDSNGVVLNFPHTTLDGICVCGDAMLAQLAVVRVALKHLLCHRWGDDLNGN
jgi:hypothetical protein